MTSKIVALYALTRNALTVSQKLNVPRRTIYAVLAREENQPLLAQACEEKNREFALAASDLVNEATEELRREIEEGELKGQRLAITLGIVHDKRARALGLPGGDGAVNRMAWEIQVGGDGAVRAVRCVVESKS